MFDTRRDAELSVERLVQEHKLPPTSVEVRASGTENSAGTTALGADVDNGQPTSTPNSDPKLGDAIEVLIRCDASVLTTVKAALRDAEASSVS